MQKTPEVAEFDIGDLLTIGIVLVVFGIAITYGLQIMSDIQTDMIVEGTAGCNSTVKTDCPAEINASMDAIKGVAKLPEKLPTIATVIAAAIIIGILIRYLYNSYRM